VLAAEVEDQLTHPELLVRPDVVGDLLGRTRERAALGGAERRPFSGSAQQIAADIGTYEKLGVSELVFDFRSEHLTETLERMERFAQTIR